MMASAKYCDCNFCQGKYTIIGVSRLTKRCRRNLHELLTDENVGILALDKKKAEENVKSELGKLNCIIKSTYNNQSR